MAVINTNITSLIGQQNLNKSASSLQTAMERLSSGSRINSAKDDAAGQAIANRMSSQITGLSQAQRNSNDGISYAQTAEGGLNQINDNLQRIRELTVQAQNGTNSASDIDSIQQEVNQRLEEIDRVARETDFNGNKMLSSSSDSSISIQVGSQDGQSIDIAISANTGWNKYDATGTAASSLELVNGEARTVAAKGFDVLSAGAGSETATVSVSMSNITSDGTNPPTSASLVTDSNDKLYIKDVTTSNAVVDATKTTGLSGASGTNTLSFVKDSSGNLFVKETDSGGAAANNKYYTVDESMIEDGAVTLNASTFTGTTVTGDSNFDGGTAATPVSGTSENVTVTATNYYEVTTDMVAKDGTGVITADISKLTAANGFDASNGLTGEGSASAGEVTLKKAGNPLESLDKALQAVDTQRSQLGAIQNRFESAITNLSTNETNLSAARSRIEDADYATEVANMTKNQILQQAGTSVLAQANQLPQSVLSLLG